MTNPRTAPNKALQLLQEAKQARIVRVDLALGVMTMTLPDGLQVSRDPLALVPAALVAVAEAEAPELGVIFKTDSPSSFRPLDWLDGGYEANHQGAEYTVYRRHTNKDGQERRDGPYWHAYITREDSEGLSWHTSIGAMVVNDFGVLVRVAKG